MKLTVASSTEQQQNRKFYSSTPAPFLYADIRMAKQSFRFMNDECVLSTCVPPNFTAWTVK